MLSTCTIEVSDASTNDVIRSAKNLKGGAKAPPGTPPEINPGEYFYTCMAILKDFHVNFTVII